MEMGCPIALAVQRKGAATTNENVEAWSRRTHDFKDDPDTDPSLPPVG